MTAPARTLAATLGALVLSAGTASAAQVQSIADTSAERGWPHAITKAEKRDLTRSVGREVARMLGTTTPRRGGCTWRACAFRWPRGGTGYARIRVYEDGSYRVLVATARHIPDSTPTYVPFEVNR